MTHEEEEAQHDISKLQEQVHQIFLSQREIKNEMEVLKKGVEAKMDDLKNGMEDMEVNIDGIEEKIKDNMEDMKNDLKAYMEGLKEGLTNLIQEMIPNGENVVHETNYEKKINVNRDFVKSNVGWKTHHIPNMDMRKFDGKDPITWIL